MCLQLALKHTQDAALERLIVAATEGDLDSVKNLLARGLPINQVNVCLLITQFDNVLVAYFFTSMALVVMRTTSAASRWSCAPVL
jgi:hypothetical protein